MDNVEENVYRLLGLELDRAYANRWRAGVDAAASAAQGKAHDFEGRKLAHEADDTCSYDIATLEWLRGQGEGARSVEEAIRAIVFKTKGRTKMSQRTDQDVLNRLRAEFDFLWKKFDRDDTSTEAPPTIGEYVAALETMVILRLEEANIKPNTFGTGGVAELEASGKSQ